MKEKRRGTKVTKEKRRDTNEKRRDAKETQRVGRDVKGKRRDKKGHEGETKDHEGTVNTLSKGRCVLTVVPRPRVTERFPTPILSSDSSRQVFPCQIIAPIKPFSKAV